MKFNSVKVFDGYSTCFRQWRADHTHCSYLHGYGVSFKVWFQGELDENNWCFDFGGMKRAKNKIEGMNPKDYFAHLLDHTVVVAEDDPYLDNFKKMDEDGIIKLRTLPHVGCERFAWYLLKQINDFLKSEVGDRVKAIKLEFREHEKNSAIAYWDC